MRQKTFIVLILFTLTSACTRPASAPGPEPATDGMRLCGAPDLQTSSGSNSTGDAIVLGVTLINQSGTACALAGQPQVMLSDHGRPLDVQYLEASPGVPPDELRLAPGELAILILTWDNYCAETLRDGPVMHLVLTPGKGLDIQAGPHAVPDCHAPGQPSTLTVSPYSYPP
jgi:hypothetical protein